MKMRDHINERYSLIVPDHVADWDAPSDWERVRFASMEEHLQRGMVLYDVGTEHGWISALYGREYVGSENLVLIEPTQSFWPNIRLTWEHNALPIPIACFAGLLDDSPPDYAPPWGVTKGSWPAFAFAEESDAGGYVYIHDHHDRDEVPQCSLDVLAFDLVERVPDAITIDVEGAELLVLKGATRALACKPLVWVSIHPDLMERDYGTTPAELLEFMERHGYYSEHLGTDHEEHWLFTAEPF